MFWASLPLLVSGAVTGCKKSAPEGRDQPASSVSAVDDAGDAPPAPTAPPRPPRCSAPPNQATLVIRGHSKTDAESDAGVDQPFATEVGNAAFTATGFAIGALRYDDGKPQAVLALASPEGDKNQVIELGAVHGPVDPPEVASVGSRVFVAVVDSDAAGPTLRLARVDATSFENASQSLTWCGDVQQGRDDSSAFSLAAAAEGGVLVWDDYDAKTQHTVVRAVTFRADDCSKPSAPRVLSPAGADAESPSIVSRPGGFWLAWLSPAPTKKADDKKPSEASAKSPESSDEGNVVDLVPHALMLMPLDAKGAPSGEARSITSSGAHVVTFDLAATKEGGALLAYRDDPTAPGAEARLMQLALVSPDGSIQNERLEDERFTAGAPSLVPDAKGPIWFGAGADNAEVLLGTVERAKVIGLDTEALLTSKQLLTASDGRLLYVEPKGRGASLGVLRCAPRKE